MVVQAKQPGAPTSPKRTNTALKEENLEGSETKKAPQSENCPLLAQCQTGETPLGQVNWKIHAFMWTFPRAFWLDKG